MGLLIEGDGENSLFLSFFLTFLESCGKILGTRVFTEVLMTAANGSLRRVS